MAYTTEADILNRIGARELIEILDDEKLSGGTNDFATAKAANASIETRLNAAIAIADAVVDANLRRIYSVPLATTPPLIAMCSNWITVYHLFSRRAAHFAVPEQVEENLDQAMRMLREIRSGDLDVGVEPSPTESDKALAFTENDPQLFTESTLDYF